MMAPCQQIKHPDPFSKHLVLTGTNIFVAISNYFASGLLEDPVYPENATTHQRME